MERTLQEFIRVINQTDYAILYEEVALGHQQRNPDVVAGKIFELVKESRES